MTPSPPDLAMVLAQGTPDQLAELCHAIRRQVLDAPAGVWDSSAVEAAELLIGAISDVLRRTAEELPIDDGCFRVEASPEGLVVVETLHHLGHERRYPAVDDAEGARELIASWRPQHDGFYHR